MIKTAALFFLASIATLHGNPVDGQPFSADLIFHHGKVWTVDETKPWAEAVAIRGNVIAKVGSNADVLVYAGKDTKLVDLNGKLMLPGFNDAHTHFELAVDWFFQVRLIDVNSQAELTKRLAKLVPNMPKGIWITGGDWSTFDARRAEREGLGMFRAFKPDLKAVDALTPNNPVLFRSYKQEYFANSETFRIGRITKHTPNPPGGVYEKDPQTGELTGMLLGSAGEAVLALVPPVTLAQKRIGALGVQRELNSFGITSIADIARIDSISQQRVEFANIERAYSDLRILQDLKSRGLLNMRVTAIVPLHALDDLAAAGIQPGGGDDWIRFGTLKAFADSGIMLQPFVGHGLSGGWTFRFPGEAELIGLIKAADAKGFDVGVHVLGDRAARLAVTAFSQAAEANPRRERRHRLIHLWYTTPQDLKRAGELRLFADVTPEHMISGIDDMKAKLDEARARTAHAWQSMFREGIRVNLVSDLPGAYNKSSLSTVDPMENIFHAVTRKASPGSTSWHPEQSLTVAQAIRAYTLNPAAASREENRKGSIREGKLADLVVLSKNIFDIPADDIPTTRVLTTVVDGRIVYSRP
jgi:predicted amidohydrolase YtcJ